MGRHLEGPVADRRDDAAAAAAAVAARGGGLSLRRHGRGGAQGRPDRPADGSVLHLKLVPTVALGKLQLEAVEPGVARLCDDEAVALVFVFLGAFVDEKRLDPLVEHVGN